MITNIKKDRHQAEDARLHASTDPGGMAESLKVDRHHWPAIPAGVIRFLGWWLAFFGLYSSSSVCPFCGQQGCPVGMASAGLTGVIFAIIIHIWNRITICFKTVLKNIWQGCKEIIELR